MAKLAPSPLDVLDFQFKLHCKLKLFENEKAETFASPCNIIGTTSRFSLVFLGTDTNTLEVINVKDLEEYTLKDGEVIDYRRRTILLASRVKHLALNCDETCLSIIIEKDHCPVAIIYEVKSFYKATLNILQEIRLSPTPGVLVTSAVWNPSISTTFTVCKSDGSFGLYEFKDSKLELVELPNMCGATCMCWSPKGKQIAIGDKMGKITQYKPDLKPAKLINSPQFIGAPSIIALHWISNYQFIGVYKSLNDPNANASLLVVDSPKTGDTVYTNYEDVCYSYGMTRPPQFYMQSLAAWNILLVASSNSMEVGILGVENENWTQWILNDNSRAELPLSASKNDTLPIGMALNYGTTKSLLIGENDMPPFPLLLLLSNYGMLCCFYAVNLKPGIPNICIPPENVLDQSGLSLFTKSNAIKPAVEIKPVAPNNSTVSNVTTPILNNNKFTFNIAPTVAPDQNVGPPKLNLLPTNNSVNASLFTTPVKLQMATTESKPAPDKSSIINATPQISVDVNNKETDRIIAQKIREECINLEADVKTLLHRSKTINVEIGTEEEATKMANTANTLYAFLKEVTDNCKTQSAEVHTLKQSVIQTWAWYEEAHSRYAVAKDPAMQAIIKLQPLDPASVRQLADIKHILYYIESQLLQANGVLDEQWHNFQDSCKKTLKFKLPTVETIYQSMVRQNSILQKQSYVLKDIAARLKFTQTNKLGPSLLISLHKGDSIEEQTGKLQIEPFDALQIHYEKILERQSKLSTSKAESLKKLIKARDISHVPINKPQYINADETIKSFLTAPLSPINATKMNLPEKPKIIQSTPLVQNTEQVGKSSLQKVLFTADAGGTFKFPSTQSNLTFNVPASKSGFPFSDQNSTVSVSSAFVPTTPQQTTFNVKSTVLTPTTTAVFTNNKTTVFSPKVTVASSAIFTPATISDTKASIFASTTSAFNLPAVSITPVTPKQTMTITQVPFKPHVVTAATTQSAFSFSSSLFSLSNIQTPEKETSNKDAVTSTNTKNATYNFNVSGNTVENKNVPFSFNAQSTSGGPAFSFGIENMAKISSISSSTNSVEVNVSKTVPEETSMGNLTEKLNSPQQKLTASSILTTPLIIPSIATSTIAAPTTIATLSKPQPAFGTAATQASTTFTFNKQSIFGTTIASEPKPIIFNTSTPTATVVHSTATIFNLPSTTKPSIVPTSAAIIETTSTSGFAEGLGLVTTTAAITSASIFTTAMKPVFTNTGFGSMTAPTTSPTPNIPLSETATISLTTSTTEQTTPFDTITSKPIFGSTPSSTSSIFGNSSNNTTSASSFVSSTSIFATAAAAASSPIFGTKDNNQSSFSTNATTAISVFSANASTVTVNNSTTFVASNNTAISQFAPVTTSSAAFASTTTSNSPFAPSSITIPSSPFAPAVSTVSSPFNTTITTAATPFVQSVTTASSPFVQTVTTASSPFGVAANSTSSIFSTTNSQSQSPFGAAATSVGTSTFNTAVSTSSSPFGATPVSSTPFGANSNTPFGSTTSSPFGANTTTAFGTKTTFGTPTSTTSPFSGSNSPFGVSNNFSFSAAAANIPNTSSSFSFNNKSTFGFGNTGSTESGLSFGGLNVSTTAASGGFGSAFGQTQQQQQNPFGKVSSTEQKSPFSGGSIFGTPSTSASTGSIFGNTNTSPFNKNTPAFGSPAAFGSQNTFGQQQPAFGQTGFSSGSMFGSPQAGAFSGGNQAVSQTGFGSPGGFSKSPSNFGGQQTFGGAPAFGASPTFGGSPAFGATPAFGAINKVFGSGSNESFGNMPQQQNSTFANLANQSTLGFGNLAQQTPPQQDTQQTGYGGGSFSTWR